MLAPRRRSLVDWESGRCRAGRPLGPPPMFTGPSFPTARTLLVDLPGAAEYLAVIDYHLAFVGTATSECSRAMYEFELGLAHTGDAYYIKGRREADVAQWGDMAVREAASVIDVAWVAINHFLALGLSQLKPLQWQVDGKPGRFRRKLEAVPGSGAKALVTAVSRMFDSIGYELIQGYRNWVTHRGAPIQRPALSILGPIPLPDKVRLENEPMRREWLLKTEAIHYVYELLKITCFPIVPPVQMTYSAHIGTTDVPIHLPGSVVINPGATNIRIENARVQSGTLWDNAADFKKRNPILVSEGAEHIAGEDLEVYSGGDYLMAVNRVEHFVAEAVHTVFDAPLRQALEEAQQPPS
jgi:hypothetical protein